MTCRTAAPYLVDLARGVIADADRRADVDRHVRECPRCAARLEGERAMSAALRRLALDAEEPPPDPERERTILAAFDAAWARPRAHTPSRRWRPLAAAAILALAATLAWAIAGRRAPASNGAPAPIAPAPRAAEASPPQPAVATTSPATSKAPVRRQRDARPIVSLASRGRSEFVRWPGASALPAFESGQLVRMDLPASVVLSLGLVPTGSQTGVIRADVLVGQDGFARAVRLVP